jgi:hypothetical protein
MTAATRHAIRVARDRVTRRQVAGANGPQTDPPLSGDWLRPVKVLEPGPDVFSAIRQYEGR